MDTIEKEPNKLNRKDIGVVCDRSGNGRYIPTSIRWGEHEWKVQRVLHSCRSVDGEYTGTRYTVIINGEEKYLYRDGTEWYVDFLGKEGGAQK